MQQYYDPNPNDSIKNEDFRLRYGHPYEDNEEKRFIVMKVFREPEGWYLSPIDIDLI